MTKIVTVKLSAVAENVREKPRNAGR